MMVGAARWTWMLCCLLLAACSRGGEESVSETPPILPEVVAVRQPDLPRVLETFAVGDKVYVRSLCVEPQRRALWVATSLGVHEIDLDSQEVRNTFTRDDGLANEYGFVIAVDRQGFKWIGTNGGGVSRYRDGEWKTYFPMHGLADYWVYSIGEQSDGTLWLGTWAGVSRIDPARTGFRNYVAELVNEWVYGIDVDSRDRVWFGTEGGISMYDGESWRSWTHDDGLGAANRNNLPLSQNTGLGTRSRHDLRVTVDGESTYNPNYVFDVLVDRQDQVWAGTWGGGVSRFDGKQWRNFTSEDGLAGDIVYAIAADGAGNLWFGTDQGLTRYDGRRWHSYGAAEGLASDSVYALAVTPDDEIWAGTQGQVIRLGQARLATEGK